jgi:hypothetical protein
MLAAMLGLFSSDFFYTFRAEISRSRVCFLKSIDYMVENGYFFSVDGYVIILQYSEVNTFFHR